MAEMAEWLHGRAAIGNYARYVLFKQVSNIYRTIRPCVSLSSRFSNDRFVLPAPYAECLACLHSTLLAVKSLARCWS